MQPPPPPPIPAAVKEVGRQLFKVFGEVRSFFKDEDLGKAIAEHVKESFEIGKEIRKCLRKRLADYVSELEKEA